MKLRIAAKAAARRKQQANGRRSKVPDEEEEAAEEEEEPEVVIIRKPPGATTVSRLPFCPRASCVQLASWLLLSGVGCYRLLCRHSHTLGPAFAQASPSAKSRTRRWPGVAISASPLPRTMTRTATVPPERRHTW